MTLVYVVCNQHGHYWGRGKRWVDGRETPRVAHYSHRDEAVNTVFELSSKDIELRCELLEMNLVDGKLPKLEISSIPIIDEESGQLALENTDAAPTIESSEEQTSAIAAEETQ
ncbi:MAG: hypothetical protein RLZZ602_1108 [Pseudomonadota bacterium]|jgi:hypothetical protein